MSIHSSTVVMISVEFVTYRTLLLIRFGALISELEKNYYLSEMQIKKLLWCHPHSTRTHTSTNLGTFWSIWTYCLCLTAWGSISSLPFLSANVTILVRSWVKESECITGFWWLLLMGHTYWNSSRKDAFYLSLFVCLSGSRTTEKTTCPIFMKLERM